MAVLFRRSINKLYWFGFVNLIEIMSAREVERGEFPSQAEDPLLNTPLNSDKSVRMKQFPIKEFAILEIIADNSNKCSGEFQEIVVRVMEVYFIKPMY